MNKRLFENYSYYLPGVRGMFALFLMFLLGAVLGNIVALPLAAVLPAESAADWVTLVSYPVMFIPPMLYARSKSKAASVFHNGLAVVTVTRDACGGCFNRIPPQRQADIRQGKKFIVCEYCGRILVSE